MRNLNAVMQSTINFTAFLINAFKVFNFENEKACSSRNCTRVVEGLHIAVQGSDTSSRKSLIKLT